MPSSVRLTSLGLSTRNCTRTSAPVRVAFSTLRPVTSTVGDSMRASPLRQPARGRTAQSAATRRPAARRDREEWVMDGSFRGMGAARSVPFLPLHPQLQPHVPFPVPIEKKPLPPAVEVEVAEDLDILQTVRLHEVQPS